MKLFGFEITRTQKAAVSPTDLAPTYGPGPWFPILESYSGAWQKGVVDQSHKNVFGFSPLFRCVTLIAGDGAKLGVRLVELVDGIWRETSSPAFSPVLRKPNRYQTWIQFVETWWLSKLIDGNTYVVKVRDSRGLVVALYVVDPRHVQTLVAPGAAVFYKIQADNLTTVDETIVVPASEIIHDRMNTLFHPLVGISPIMAASLSGALGVEIQRQSATFYKNGARPSALITGPHNIPNDVATRLKATFEEGYSGDNVGRVAVAGSGLDFKAMAMKAVDAQLVEHLKLSAEMVCHAFGVPLFKVGIGQLPANSNVAMLNQMYYQDCLQKHIEDFEWALDDGLSLPQNYGVELNVKNLLRMDPKTQMETLGIGVERRFVAINEARREIQLPPTPGGDRPWMQMQDMPLDLLDQMQRQGGALDAPEPEAPPAEDETTQDEEQTRMLDNVRLCKAFERSLAA